MLSEHEGATRQNQADAQEADDAVLAAQAEANASVHWRAMGQVALLRDDEIAEIFAEAAEIDDKMRNGYRRELLELGVRGSELDEVKCKRAMWLVQRLLYSVAAKRGMEWAQADRQRIKEMMEP